MQVSLASRAETTTLLTGHHQWNYYQIGKAFCEVHKHQSQDIKCHARPSHGSAWNLTQIQQGNYRLGFAQSDITLQFVQSRGKENKIRILKKIMPQLYLILVRDKDKRIQTIEDLKAKVINLGPPGSGLHATNQIVFSAANLIKLNKNAYQHHLFRSITIYPAPKAAALLCSGKVDAITYILETDEHGNTPRLQNIMQRCPMRILSLSEGLINKLLLLKLGYRKTQYQQQPTLGLDMLLVGRITAL